MYIYIYTTYSLSLIIIYIYILSLFLLYIYIYIYIMNLITIITLFCCVCCVPFSPSDGDENGDRNEHRDVAPEIFVLARWEHSQGNLPGWGAENIWNDEKKNSGTGEWLDLGRPPSALRYFLVFLAIWFILPSGSTLAINDQRWPKSTSEVQQTCEPRAHTIESFHMVIQWTWAALKGWCSNWKQVTPGEVAKFKHSSTTSSWQQFA